jgi:hypothetical protein
MTSHEDMLQRMNGANPLPDVEMITDGQLAELTLMLEDARRTGNVPVRPQELIPSKPRVRWLRPAIAFGSALLMALAVIGIVSLVTRGGFDLVDEPPPRTTGAPPPTEAPEAPAIPFNQANQIFHMVVTGDHDLWVTTLGGIVQWDLATQTHTVHSPDDGPAGDGFGRLLAAADGTVWAEGDGALARFDGSWTTYPPLSEAPFGHVRPGEDVAMAVGPDGALWAAVGPDELGRFDGSEWEIFETPYPANMMEWAWASDLAVASDGTVWAALQGTSGGSDPESPVLERGAVASFDGTRWSLYTTGEGLPDGVRAITVAPDGTVWAMSFGWGWSDSNGSGSVPGQGVARFDGNAWTRYTEADGLPSNDSDIVVGLDGSVWAIDIEGSGISRFDGNSWTDFPRAPRHSLPAVVDAAGTLWMPSGESRGGIVGVNGEDTFRLLVPVEVGPVAAPTTTVVPAPEEWNSILADTQAGPTPPTATCPPGTSPDKPGPGIQDRPEAGSNGVLAAAFDQRSGQIIYVDTAGDTWGFEVCTNTWRFLDPSGIPPSEVSAGLVYDVDSDLTIALGSTVSVYDAKSNTWTWATGSRALPFGAVYDPLSGLVVTTFSGYGDDSSMELWAFDVDTDTRTLVGRISHEGDLLGYTSELDRFIIALPDNRTMLLDPRSGETTLVDTETPAVQFGWPKASYDPTQDTVFVAYGVKRAAGMIVTVFPGYLCGFDPETLTWSSCFASPGGTDYAGFGAIVGDPINDRLVIINGISGNFWVNATEHVWAIDLETGELAELLTVSE